jgi:peptidoglycan-associated lipoprotein
MKLAFCGNDRRFAVMSLLLAVVLLTGCPKKVAPVGKGPKPFSDQGLSSEEPAPSRVPITPKSVTEEELTEETPAVAGTLDRPSTPLGDILFDFGQWTIQEKEMVLLEQNAGWLSTHAEVQVEVEGHADLRGTNEYNLVLGEKRANAVQEYLVQLGVDPARLLVISYGEERPACTMEDDSCHEKNRRVHFRAR